MLVFISWSGETSREVAKALSDWLPDILQQAKPFMSAQDIQAGTRWSRTLGKRMEKCNFGVSCITADNRQKPWIMFEAGALSKQVTNARVVPYLHKVETSDLDGPLDQFQAVKADKDGTRRLLESIYEALPSRVITLDRMKRIFEKLWPNLESALAAIKDPDPTAIPPNRTVEEMLHEILAAIRNRESLPLPTVGISFPDVGPGDDVRAVSAVANLYRQKHNEIPKRTSLLNFYLSLNSHDRQVLAKSLRMNLTTIEDALLNSAIENG